MQKYYSIYVHYNTGNMQHINSEQKYNFGDTNTQSQSNKDQENLKTIENSGKSPWTAVDIQKQSSSASGNTDQKKPITYRTHH